MLPSVTIHPPARTDHQDTVQLPITSLHLTTHCTLQGITQPHSTLLQAALPQRNISKSHSPRQVLGSSGSSSHFPTPREDGPAASRWPAPCCSPELCPSAESPGAAQPLKPTPLRTQTLVCGCCAAFRIFFFPFPFFIFIFFPEHFVRADAPASYNSAWGRGKCFGTCPSCLLRACVLLDAIHLQPPAPTQQNSNAGSVGQAWCNPLQQSASWGNLEPAVGTQCCRGHAHSLTLLLSKKIIFWGCAVNTCSSRPLGALPQSRASVQQRGPT